MKTVVLGGTGLIGKKVVDALKARGHEVIVASRRDGFDAMTGEGVERILRGADVVIDTMDSPSFEDGPAKDFFTTTTNNIVKAVKNSGVKHYVALSVVGTQNLQVSGYFQGKLQQENLIEDSGIPYTIVRATQFYEFSLFIGQVATEEKIVRLPSAKMQPIAAIDVAKAIAEIATGKPYNRIVDVAGPNKINMSVFVEKALAAQNDSRKVVVDENALYVKMFPVNDSTLTPGQDPILGSLTFDAWLADPSRSYK